MVVRVEVAAPRFPVFSLFSLLLFRYLLPPPPPTARPPASALHHLVSREAHLRWPVRTTALERRECVFLPSGRARRRAPWKAPQLSLRCARLRGEAATWRFFAPPAPPMMMLLLLLLSERRNRQWDRSPSSACTSLPCAGSAPLSFENGGSARR